MSVPILESSFLANRLTSNFKPQRKINTIPVKTVLISSKQSEEDFPSKSENQFGKLALVALAAGVLTLGSVDPASAAKTGGRVGGQAFRSSAPRSSGPRINNSRTNVYVNPPVAPPLVGGYGYGFGVPFYGGWGWSPFSFFAPGPSVAVGIGGGVELFALFLFLGAVSAVVRRLRGSRDEDDDDGY
ncbi:uncharacterized protein LOC111380726 [Olea europaea subsp. europaea]|uniref:Uncharacterized protein LOC111380726 n=1 Tax=Olea europaea subsp. europaea TaxID=158383 RepID=A0A8S0VE42_OLEEU|nr:uncharacterized protein LOC111380726 [Olea europaea subsp. europaea]